MTRDKLNQSLIDASLAGDAEEVKFLLELGADVHKDDDYAVRLASEYGRVEVVQLLIAAGADVRRYGDYALRSAVENGHDEVVKILTDWKGANK